MSLLILVPRGVLLLKLQCALVNTQILSLSELGHMHFSTTGDVDATGKWTAFGVAMVLS